MPEQKYDVAVVGSGVAGLSTAVSAAENGARVVVIERAPRKEYGGNTRYTEAFLRMRSESEVSDDFADRFFANAGYHVDPALAAESMRRSDPPGMTRTLNMVDPELIGELEESAGPTLAWLKEMGVTFTPIESPFLVKATTRWAPSGGGLQLIESLMRRFEKLGGEVRYETAALALEIDQTTGQVAGLRCRAAGALKIVAANAVVLACGGFEGNPEMLSRYIANANYTRPVARGGYYNRGEGIAMALEVGAAACGDFQLFHAEPIDPRSGEPEAALFIFPFGLLVNQRGERFVDEAQGAVDATYESVTRDVLRQPDGVAYVILDGGVEDVPNYRTAIRTDQPAITADSLEELAVALDVPADQLRTTVEQYNAACEKNGDFDPTRVDGLSTHGLLPPKSNWARPLDSAPFRAYPMSCANVFTFGGLKTNRFSEVLDTSGDIIRGLYAAGETAGIYFGTYTGSTSVLRGAVFGRIAGSEAARLSREPAEVCT